MQKLQFWLRNGQDPQRHPAVHTGGVIWESQRTSKWHVLFKRYSNLHDKKFFLYISFFKHLITPIYKSKIYVCKKKSLQTSNKMTLVNFGSEMVQHQRPALHTGGVSRGSLWLWLLALVTCDRWHMTHDPWKVTHYMWYVTLDTWHLTPKRHKIYKSLNLDQKHSGMVCYQQWGYPV